MWIVRLAIYRPITTLMIELFLIVLGVVGYQRIGLDLFPKIEPPVMTITTEYPGAGPREVETQVSKIIEEEINQIGGIEKLTSFSRENVSRVIVEFTVDTDARMAQIEVQNKLARIKSKLPKEVEEPLIQRLDFADRPIIKLAITIPEQHSSTLFSQIEKQQRETYLYRDIANTKIKPRLQQVQGVGDVRIFGGREREILIELDRNQLTLLKITPSEIADAIRSSNINQPLGELLELEKERSLRVLGEFTNAHDIESVLIKTLDGGRRILVGDVAKVIDGFKDKESIAKMNGREIVMLEIKKQSGANTVEVADAVKASLPEIQKIIPSGFDIKVVYDGARQVRMSLDDVIESLVVAALLAFLVVYFFLGSIESTLITGIALPCTVIVTFFLLYILGFTLNTMTLLGITLAVGLILDDAIVVRENIWNKLEQGLSPIQAAETGTAQVYKAVLATSLTIIATFFPVTFIPGIVGKFFSAFALTVCIGMIVSTFDALTMAPLLSAHLTKPKRHTPEPQKANFLLRTFERFWSSLEKYYKFFLIWSVYRPKRMLGFALILFLCSLGSLKFIGFTFLPQNENGEIDINIETPPGTRIEKTSAIIDEIDRAITAHNAVYYTVIKLGNEFNDATVANIYVRLVERSKRSHSTGDMKKILRKTIEPYQKLHKLETSVQDAGGGGPGRAVSIAITGNDALKLKDLGDQVVSKVSTTIPGITNLKSNMRDGKSEIQFLVNHAKAAQFGVRTFDISNTIKGLYEGDLAGSFRDGGEEYDIRVRFSENERGIATDLENQTIRSPDKELIPLQNLTTLTHSSITQSIIRLNQQRSVIVEGDLQENTPLGEALSKVQDLVTPLIPSGYFLQFQGQAKSMNDLKNGMFIALALGALFVFMIMASLYESIIIPFSILLTLPLAIIGALLALLISGRFLDVYTVIGMILLMGLVTKNGILIVDHAEQLRLSGKSSLDSILDAGIRRFRPIMMTSIAMIAGMLPIALGMSELNQMRAGMGIACIGGLLSSTVLSLIVIPCAYLLLDKVRYTRFARHTPAESALNSSLQYHS